jgi:DNA-directed RNA polymerase specialized sigma24 family protein
MTRWACSKQARFLTCRRRDAQREKLLRPSLSENDNPWEGFSHEPTPEEAATVSDTIEHLKQRCTDLQRRVLELQLQGTSPSEICSQLGSCRRTIYRVQHAVEERLLRQPERFVRHG